MSTRYRRSAVWFVGLIGMGNRIFGYCSKLTIHNIYYCRPKPVTSPEVVDLKVKGEDCFCLEMTLIDAIRSRTETNIGRNIVRNLGCHRGGDPVVIAKALSH